MQARISAARHQGPQWGMRGFERVRCRGFPFQRIDMADHGKKLEGACARKNLSDQLACLLLECASVIIFLQMTLEIFRFGLLDRRLETQEDRIPVDCTEISTPTDANF